MKTLIIIGAVCSVLVLGTLLSVIWWVPSIAERTPGVDAGQLGDMFGLANALFSGLAFSAFIVTMLMQYQELKLQREDLKFTREEIRGQKEALENQNRLLRDQSREEKISALIRLHLEVVAALKVSPGGKPVAGDEAFVAIIAAVENEVENIRTNDKLDVCVAYHEAWRRVFSDSKGPLTKYWQSLQGLLVTIEGCIPESQVPYLDRIRDHMTQREVAVLIFYSRLSAHPEDGARICLIIDIKRSSLVPEAIPGVAFDCFMT